MDHFEQTATNRSPRDFRSQTLWVHSLMIRWGTYHQSLGPVHSSVLEILDVGLTWALLLVVGNIHIANSSVLILKLHTGNGNSR